MAAYLDQTFDDVQIADSWGYTMFFVGAERTMPFVTTIAADTEHDRVSDLNRPGVYRLNIGVDKLTFEALMDGAAAPDYTALNVLMPHPHYAAQSWLCILAPSDQMFEALLKPLLAQAYARAKHRLDRRER